MFRIILSSLCLGMFFVHKAKAFLIGIIILLLSNVVGAWEANVTNILQHGSVVAVSLSPDPGVGNCEYGSPYIIFADGTPANNQLFSMLLTALSTGNKVAGYADACTTTIWGQSRPTISRLNLRNN